MSPGVLLKGLAIGFAIAAPVGPIGVLCIRRTLADGRLAGLVSGLGAATADALYGCVAAFGLTAVSSFLISQQTWLRLLGGLFLRYLGVRTLLAAPAEKPAIATGRRVRRRTTAEGRPIGSPGRGLLAAYTSTFALTVANPATILSFAAIFAGLGAGITSRSYASAALLVSGVFLGSALWWLLLSGGVSLFRSRLQTRGLRWVNRISGAVITAFGVLSLLSIR
jgi:threonine/homoserine/homoserine lactone efflux protein